MRNLKKVLALVLAFSMMLSVVAFAAYPDVAEDADYADAVELLSALNVIKGDDLGNFNPENTITRAEYAAIVCRVLGLEASATGAQGATDFVDVAADHWASGYINLASQYGIVNGYGDGNFGPEDKVTYEQAVKMLVCAIGFEPAALQNGGWPAGYLKIAAKYKITAGVAATVEAPRKTVAKLVYNALSTPKMDQSSFGANAEWEVLDGKNGRSYATLLTDMNIFMATGVVGTKEAGEDIVTFGVRESSLDYEFGITGDSKKDGYIDIYDATGYDLDLYINDSDIMDYVDQYVDVYVEKDSRGDYYVLAVVPSLLGETLTIISDDVKDVNGSKLTYYVDGSSKTKTIKFEGETVPFSLNKVEDDDYAIKNLVVGSKEKEAIDSDVELVLVENTGNGKFDKIVATKYQNAVVDDVDDDRIKLNGKWVTLDLEDETKEYVFVDAKGNALELSDFATEDVVAVVSEQEVKALSDATYIKLIKLSDSKVEGIVSETSTQYDKDFVWINDTKYETVITLNNEDEGIFYISMTGKIFDFEGTSSLGNIGYILEAGISNKGTFDDGAWIVKLLTSDDGVVEYTLTEAASEDFADYIDSLLDDGKLLWKNSADSKDNAKRIVEYKTNSKGYIKSIEAADDGDVKVDSLVKGAYKEKTQKLGGKIIDDDAVIFDVTGSKVESAYASDISYLVDEAEYEYVAVRVDGDYKLIVVVDGEAKLSDEVGFAIVTETRRGSKDGEDTITIEYIQDMTEGTAVFTDDSELIAGPDKTDYEDLKAGDVIMINANAEGKVSSYAILGVIDEKEGILVPCEAALKAFSKENKFVFGYIANDESASNKAEVVVFGDEEISIDDFTNTYLYFNGRRDVEIKLNWDAEDADWADIETVEVKEGDEVVEKDQIAETTIFFARIVDRDVIDFYAFNDRKDTNFIKNFGFVLDNGADE